MQAGEHFFVGGGATGSRPTAPPPDQSQPPAGDPGLPARPAMRRLPMALAWAAGAAALFTLFLRVSLTGAVISDGANTALQAWDMLHGHLLLHGWLVGDATFYTFELPLVALVEVFFGLHTIAVHVAMAVIYLIVAVSAVAIAVTGATGAAARLRRAAVVVAVLAAPTLIVSDRWIPLGFPDHMGSSVFLLVSCLLVDRLSSRRFTAPLLCVILCAGQISDGTVRYVAAPAICAVCAYRVLAARNIRTGDAANLVAAAVSLPLATAARALMRHLGAYLMVSPRTSLAPVSRWPHNAAVTWYSLRRLFGIQAAPHEAAASGWAVVFGAACLLAVTAGFLAVLLRWPRASRAEQVLTVAIAVNIVAYLVSRLPTPYTPHDLAFVLPAGAVLAARACVPARLAGRLPRLAVGGAAAVAALLPLSLVAAQPSARGADLRLTDWLTAHGLSYGLGGYWQSSALALQTGNRVQIRTIKVRGGAVRPFPWETNLDWFDPARHRANFILVQGGKDPATVAALERIFGKPVMTERIGTYEILVYRKNLLTEVKRPITRPLS